MLRLARQFLLSQMVLDPTGGNSSPHLHETRSAEVTSLLVVTVENKDATGPTAGLARDNFISITNLEAHSTQTDAYDDGSNPAMSFDS